jgi:ABC-2 type transport system ATP-binding protein
MRELILELRQMGKTILVSSHILPELEELCTWVGFIDRGRMAAVGPLADVRDQVVSTGRRLRVELTDPSDENLRAAAEVIRGRAGVRDVRVIGSHLELSVLQELPDDELLSSLIMEKIKVRSFAPIAGDLSDAFMRLTAEPE